MDGNVVIALVMVAEVSLHRATRELEWKETRMLHEEMSWVMM